MQAQNQRLFIKSLPENVTNTELEQKFKSYGTVTSTEIKERKNNLTGESPFFAYINIESSHSDLQRCLQDFANKKWKGSYIDVQLAKESFLSRLKREREGENSSTNTERTSVVNNISLRPQININVVRQSYSNNVPNKKFKYDREGSESDVEKPSGEITKEIVTNDRLINGESDMVIKNNKFRTLNGSLKIESFHSKPNGEIAKKEVKKLDPEHLKADEKRKQSIIHMRKGFMQQKSQIKAALANVNVKSKNKITFDTDESKHENQKQAKKNKLSLFDESDNDEDFSANFEIKKQFEGKKGQKLLELQSKFKNDSRFAVDERFLEDEDEHQEETTKESNEEMTYEEEKEKQFEILEEVLGVKVSKKVTDEKSRKQIGMLRFDPSQPEHDIYEIKTAKPEAEKKSKKKRKLEKESSEAKDVDEPEVSKTKFYKVTEDLKGVFQKESNSGFSLLSAFKQNETFNDEDRENDQEKELEIIKEKDAQKKKKIFPLNIENAFKYDSSDEDQNQEAETTSETQTKKGLPSKRSKQLWTEPFFFGDDDYRLQEGFDFIKRLEVEENTEFSKVRGKLKEIIRAKVRNNQRKNKMFKKKLGGRKKRIKMKKALKK